MLNIIVERGTQVTQRNLFLWFQEFKKDLERLEILENIHLNRKRSKSVFDQYLKLPFAKKLVITSSKATVGDGVTLAEPEEIQQDKTNGGAESQQTATFNEIVRLFNKQNMKSQDSRVIKNGVIFGRAYELTYMSSDEIPVPKCALIPTTNAFIVYDDTVECKALYGVYFSEFKKDNGKCINFYIVDDTNTYHWQVKDKAFTKDAPDLAIVPVTTTAHHIGCVPLIEYRNNDEQQSDFEQVIGLMRDRTDLHNLNMRDARRIPKNVYKAKNVKFAGVTEDDKVESTEHVNKSMVLEFETEEPNTDDDVNIVAKNENYTSITEFGKDIDSKIYDLTMIPDLSAEQFAGNQTGVALELKLLPFKEMVEDKDVHIENLYKSRLMHYCHALTNNSTKFQSFDTDDIPIMIVRNWNKNIVEIATIISTLKASGMFSDKTLTEMMPNIDYDDEQAQIQKEDEERSKQNQLNPNMNNPFNEELRAALQSRLAPETKATDGGDTQASNNADVTVDGENNGG